MSFSRRIIYFIVCALGIALLSLSFVKSGKDSILLYGSMGYDKQNLYIYSVVVMDATGIVVHHDTIGLYSSDVPMSNAIHDTSSKQNVMLWRFLRKDSIGMYKLKYVKSWNYNEFTGIRQNAKSLFIHPPREDYFRILEFCPYPAFEKAGKVGEVWHWDFAIGPVWRIDSVYPICSVDTFRIDYKISDTLSQNTFWGRLFCFQVDGISSSKYGITYSKFYLNENFGMVLFDATTIYKTHFRFTLIDRVSDLAYISEILPELDYYPFDYNRKKNNWELFGK